MYDAYYQLERSGVQEYGEHPTNGFNTLFYNVYLPYGDLLSVARFW